jgi:hypothetical protein
LRENTVADIKKNDGTDVAAWPVDESQISDWHDERDDYPDDTELWDGPEQIRFSIWSGSGDSLYHDNRFGHSTNVGTSSWYCYDGLDNDECVIEDPSHYIETSTGSIIHKLEGDVYTARNGSSEEIENKRTKDDAESLTTKCYGSWSGNKSYTGSFSTKVKYPLLDIEVGGVYHDETASCTNDDYGCEPGGSCDCDLDMPPVDSSDAAKLSDFDILGTYDTPSSGDGEWVWTVAIGKTDLENDEYTGYAICSNDENDVDLDPTSLSKNTTLTGYVQDILDAGVTGSLAYEILQ